MTEPACAGELPDLDVGVVMYAILGGGVVMKILLYLYCRTLKAGFQAASFRTCLPDDPQAYESFFQIRAKSSQRHFSVTCSYRVMLVRAESL